MGTQKCAAQFNRQRRGQTQRRMGQRTFRRKSRSGNTTTNQEKKGYEGRKGPQPRQWKECDTTYQPFSDDAPRDLTFGQSGDPRQIACPNWSTHLCCSPGTGRSRRAFSRADARPLAASQTEPCGALRTARALPASLPSWIARLDSAESAKTRSATCFRQSPRELIGAEASRGDDMTERKL